MHSSSCAPETSNSRGSRREQSLSRKEQTISPQCLALLDALKARGIPIRHLATGDRIALPRSSLTVTWPLPGAALPGQDANRYSLCLLCDLDGVKLLTCADVPGDYEAYAARDADILKVSHHGSKTSTGEDFLKAVSPQIALITASPMSSRLPNPDTVERILSAGASIRNTVQTGAVTIIAKQGEASVTTFLSIEEQP